MDPHARDCECEACHPEWYMPAGYIEKIMAMIEASPVLPESPDFELDPPI